jgi:predicted dehydrogenase
MLGKLVSISTSFNANFPPDDNFRFKKKLSGGGALRDLGSHMIDLLRFFGGEIIEIKGNVDNVVYNSEVDDFANAIVKFEKSGYGFFNVSFNTKKPFNRIEILGYRGSLTIENLIGKKSSSTRLIINLDGEAKKSFRRRANKLNYTLRSVQNSLMKNEMPKVNGYDGLVNMQLIENLERQCGRNLT